MGLVELGYIEHLLSVYLCLVSQCQLGHTIKVCEKHFSGKGILNDNICVTVDINHINECDAWVC